MLMFLTHLLHPTSMLFAMWMLSSVAPYVNRAGPWRIVAGQRAVFSHLHAHTHIETDVYYCVHARTQTHTNTQYTLAYTSFRHTHARDHISIMHHTSNSPFVLFYFKNSCWVSSSSWKHDDGDHSAGGSDVETREERPASDWWIIEEHGPVG